MKLVELTCPKCGAVLQVNDALTRCTCNYCGNEILIDNEQRELKITGGYDFGYGNAYGRLQAEYDFNQQHISEQQQITEQQRRAYNKQVKVSSLKKSWYYGTVVGVVGFFSILILTSQFALSVIAGILLLIATFGVSFKILLKLYLEKNTEG